MNKANIKKLLPGVISIIIIAGMAASTFATNIDLAAFVNKEKHMERYNEVNFRIDDIESYLDRLYKFTCTNVKSFGGQQYSQNGGLILFNYYSGSDFGMMPWPHVDLSEQKYLRYNYKGALQQSFSHPSTTHRWQYKKPASLFKWRPGIELTPNCTVEINFARTMNTTSWSADASFSSVELVMGPFKKFPRITSTGSSLTGGYICEFPDYALGTSILPSAGSSYYQYAYGSETRPTAWTNESTMRMYLGTSVTATKTSPTTTQYDVDEIKEKMDNDTYTDRSARYIHNNIYYYTAPGVDFSKYENFWLRMYYSENASTGIVYYSNFAEMNLSTWNAGK